MGNSEQVFFPVGFERNHGRILSDCNEPMEQRLKIYGSSAQCMVLIPISTVIVEVKLPDILPEHFHPCLDGTPPKSGLMTGIQTKSHPMCMETFEEKPNLIGIMLIYIFKH
jgi:hypothetical protein